MNAQHEPGAPAKQQAYLQINCETTNKMLARTDVDGLYLWCKPCKAEHFIPWRLLPHSFSIAQMEQKPA